MTASQQLTYDWFSKPGDSVLALMRRRGVSTKDLAERLDGGIETLRGLLDGSIALDTGTATTLAAALGGTLEFWLTRQANYEQALSRAVKAAAESAATDWLQRVPVPGAKPRGRLNEARLLEELRRRLIFFNVSNLKSWESRYGGLAASTRFRTSASFISKDESVLLWLRQGELEADLVTTRSWKPSNLKERLADIRKISTISRPDRFLPKLREICAEAGVAIVVVKAPNGCRASGASRLVAPDKAMILLSFRHRADDHFWFTVFHEIGHLLLHDAQTFVDEDGAPIDEAEEEANDFASSCIIPEKRRSEFERLGTDLDSIIRFSVSIGVSPGLIVGQMQHREMIPHQRLNSLKRRWTWDDIEPALVA